MAIVYVDVDGVGGSEYDGAATNLESAMTAANAGDTVLCAPGVYVVTAYNLSKTLTIKGDQNYDGWVKIDSSSVADKGILLTAGGDIVFKRVWFYNSSVNQPVLNIHTCDSITMEDCVSTSLEGKGILVHQGFLNTFHAKRTMFLGAVNYNIMRQLTGNSYTEIYDACIFSGGSISLQSQIVAAGTSTRTWNNCIFGGTEGVSSIVITAGATGADIMNNCIIMPRGRIAGSAAIIADLNVSPTITANNCIIMQNWLSDVVDDVEVVDGGDNIGLVEGEDVQVRFKTPRRSTASISVMIDDLGQAIAPDGPTFAALGEARGIPVCFCVQSKLVTDDNAELLADYINRGHGVSLHGATGAEMEASNHPAIHLAGPSPSTVTIANGIMSFTGTGVSPGAPYTLDEETPVGSLVETINNNFTGWTATQNPGTANSSSLTVTATLADVSAVDVSGAGATLDLDEDRFNFYELTTGKALLEAAIQPHIPSWTCMTHVWSGGKVDAASEQAALDAGLTGARGAASEQLVWSGPGYTTGYRPYRSPGLQLLATVYTDANATLKAGSMCEAIKWHGLNCNVYNHNLTGSSPSATPLDATKWGLILDAIKASGLRTLTYDDQAAEMRTGASIMTAGLEYTRDFIDEDIAWTPELLPESQASAAGKGLQSRQIVGIDGQPIATINADIGAVQGVDPDNHPFAVNNL